MTTYFVKLLSSVPPERLVFTSEQIIKNLKVNPLKVENLLKRGKGSIIRARSLEKAVKTAYVFRKAGIVVEVITQEEPLPSSVTLTIVPESETTTRAKLKTTTKTKTKTKAKTTKHKTIPTLYDRDAVVANSTPRPFWRKIPGFRSSTLRGSLFTLVVYCFLTVALLFGSIGSLNKSMPKEVFASSIQTRTAKASAISPNLLARPQVAVAIPTKTAMNNEQAIHELDDFFELEISPLRDGTPRLLGTGINGMSFIELIGDPNNLETATIFIEASADDKAINTQNFLLMSLFTENLLPEWQGSQKWLTNSIPQLLTLPESKVSTVVGNKAVNLTTLPQTAVVSLSFSRLP